VSVCTQTIGHRALALTRRRAASPVTSRDPRRPGRRGHTHTQTQHRPVPSLATGRSPLPRCHHRHCRAATTVTAHATAMPRPSARGRLYSISSSASCASAHTLLRCTHEHKHTFLPHRILLRPTRGSTQSARRRGGGEAVQPDTTHDATGPGDASARDESEAQAILPHPELARLVITESACEPSRVDEPDRAGPSLSAQKRSRAPFSLFPFPFSQPNLWTPPASLEVRLTSESLD
jgi:hypothetical protein